VTTLTGSIPALAEKIGEKIAPHLPHYAAQLALAVVPDTVFCAEGQDYIDLDNEDWVLLRDAFNENSAFVFHPSHRTCAIEAWGEGHIIG
jgi:hypothetical protein